MRTRPAEILLVVDDAELVEMMERYLTEAIPVRITTAASPDEALREELTHRHDVVLVDLDLQDGDAIDMIRQLRVSNHCPLIVTTGDPNASQLIDAIHLGVRDILIKPFEMEELNERLCRAIRTVVRRHRMRHRYNRLRVLTARIIRERRELKQRTDLLCQDLVSAYRGLAQKVSESGILAGQ